MVALSLKISVGNVVKTMQFEPSTMVYDACRVIRERVPEAQLGQREFSLFLSLFLSLLSHSVSPLPFPLTEMWTKKIRDVTMPIYSLWVLINVSVQVKRVPERTTHLSL